MTSSPPINKTVVICHGSSDVQQKFCDALKEAGHKTVSANTRSELLECMRQNVGMIDLLLLDLSVIKLEDKTISQSLKNIPIDGSITLIFSGSLKNAREILDLTDVGITNYINEYSSTRQILPSLTPHLFPNNFDRRTSSRIVLNIPITYKCKDTIATAVTLNISKGGLGIRTINPAPPGSKVEVRFRLPGCTSEIKATSHTAWSDKQVGMGLQFEQVDSVNQSIIDTFIDQQVLN